MVSDKRELRMAWRHNEEGLSVCKPKAPRDDKTARKKEAFKDVIRQGCARPRKFHAPIFLDFP